MSTFRLWFRCLVSPETQCARCGGRFPRAEARYLGNAALHPACVGRSAPITDRPDSGQAYRDNGLGMLALPFILLVALPFVWFRQRFVPCAKCWRERRKEGDWLGPRCRAADIAEWRGANDRWREAIMRERARGMTPSPDDRWLLDPDFRADEEPRVAEHFGPRAHPDRCGRG